MNMATADAAGIVIIIFHNRNRQSPCIFTERINAGDARAIQALFYLPAV